MTAWHNKHIATKWGVLVLGILVVATVILIPVLGQTQDNRSHASGGQIGDVCYIKGLHGGPRIKGECLERWDAKTGKPKTPCSTFYDSSNDCPTSPDNVQCCADTSVSCKTPQGSGYCYNSSGDNKDSCTGGSYKAGYCPGPNDVQCCVANKQGGLASPIKTDTCASLNSSTSKASCTNNCQGGGSYVDGYCSGGTKCCVQSTLCQNYASRNGGVGYCLTVNGKEVGNYPKGKFVSGNLCPGPSNIKCYFIPGR